MVTASFGPSRSRVGLGRGSIGTLVSEVACDLVKEWESFEVIQGIVWCDMIGGERLFLECEERSCGEGLDGTKGNGRGSSSNGLAGKSMGSRYEERKKRVDFWS